MNKIEALNDIVTGLGGTGGYKYEIQALNAWAVLVGAAGGYKYEIQALNAIDKAKGGTGLHKYNIDALNSICKAAGGSGLNKYEIAALVFIGSLLNQNEPEVDAYIAGLATPLSSEQIGKLNTFVAALKTGLGISALSDAFDVMYILAGETAESSLKNLVKNAHHATAVNSPDFTALEGFTGNGTTSYINTNYIPNFHKINFALDYASLGIYIRNNTSGDVVDMGARDFFNKNRTYIQAKGNSTVSYGNVNQDSFAISPLLIDTSIGMTIYNRISSTILNNSKNKQISTNIEYESSGIPSYSVTIGALNTADEVVLFTNRQYSFAFLGKGLTTENIIALVNAIEAYMDSNGKGVIA